MNDTADRFLKMVWAALSSGVAHLGSTSGGRPAQPDRVGWHSDDGKEYRAKGDCIGFIEGDEVYLLPEAAVRVAKKMANDTQEYLPVQLNTLQQRLHESGYLA